MIKPERKPKKKKVFITIVENGEILLNQDMEVEPQDVKGVVAALSNAIKLWKNFTNEDDKPI